MRRVTAPEDRMERKVGCIRLDEHLKIARSCTMNVLPGGKAAAHSAIMCARLKVIC